MKKLALIAAAGIFAAAAVAEENSAAAPAPVSIIDEISLEIDDSAEAGKTPQVAFVAGGETAPATNAAPETAAAEKDQSKAEFIANRFRTAPDIERVNISSDDATLKEVLRQFRKVTRENIIYSESSSNLNERVSVSFKNVPWTDALSAILNSRGFRLESRDNIYYVREEKAVNPVRTRSFQLNHASSTELADLFNKSYGVVDGTGKVVKRVATSFEGANVVVVTAPESVISDCESIVKSVDRAVPQIYIEARFIELSNEALHKLGMQWNQLSSWGASVKGMSGGMEYGSGRAREGSNPPNQTPWLRSADGTYRDMPWMHARGFTGQLSFDDFRLAMSAFENLNDAKIFSNPKIIVSNGKEALVDMTTKFPNVTIKASRGGMSEALDITAQLEVIPGEDKYLFAKQAFFSWGITLTVKPRISPDGLISVSIVPQISELDRDYATDGFYTIKGVQEEGDAAGVYGSYPIIKVKRLTTDFTMQDGATAVIGGLTKTTEEDIDSGIPYLRKIPWIGPKLFGWKSRGKVQREIIVFVTVGIADPSNLPEDVGLPTNAVGGREYVNGERLEPGLRGIGSKQFLQLDRTPLDERPNLKRGDVLITVVPDEEPAEEAKPAEDAPAK